MQIFCDSGEEVPQQVLAHMADLGLPVTVENAGSLGVIFTLKGGKASDPVKEVIEHLNEKANRSYKYTAKNTVKHVKRILGEGFSVEDAFKVIDKKADDWLGSDMAKYLRPETLFSGKFESYLQEISYSESSAIGEANTIDRLNKLFGRGK